MKITLYVYIGSTPIVVQPERLVIEEAEGLHDMATLSFGGPIGHDLVAQLDLANVSANDIGPPAAIEITAGGIMTIVYGYIDTTVETTRRTADSMIDVYFLSATSIMRNGSPRVWRDQRPFDIACDILAPYGLGLEMDKVTNPIASFAQSSESDWETLRNLANHIGLSLTAAGPIVRIKDVINETRRARSTLLTSRFRRPGSVNSPALECSQFTQVASRTPIGGERYRYYGIDQLGASFEISGGVSAIEKSPGIVVRSLGAALREARRHQSIGRFVTCSTLQGAGIVGCSAGTCIAVDNRRTPEYWYITNSTHTLDQQRDEHSMTLELCRQDASTPGYVSASVPPQPHIVLIGKAWRCDRSWRFEL